MSFTHEIIVIGKKNRLLLATATELCLYLPLLLAGGNQVKLIMYTGIRLTSRCMAMLEMWPSFLL